MFPRKIRVYTRPLGAEDPGSMRGPDLEPVNHWALVIGEPPELLLEVVPVQGKTVFTPLNKLQITYSRDGLGQKLKIFKPCGPQKNITHLRNDDIIKIASSIVRKNPIYNIWLRNCQHFVLDLLLSIAGCGQSYDFVPTTMGTSITLEWQQSAITDEEEYNLLVDMLAEMKLVSPKPALTEVRQIVEKIESGTKTGGFYGEMCLPELTGQEVSILAEATTSN